MRKNRNTEPLLNKKRILVTGGSCFIGSHLVDEFLAKGHSVTVLSACDIFSKARILGSDLPDLSGSKQLLREV